MNGATFIMATPVDTVRINELVSRGKLDTRQLTTASQLAKYRHFTQNPSAGVAQEREVGEAVIIKPEGSDAKSESWGREDPFERPQISQCKRGCPT
jgi:hypothetical protein